MNWNTLIDFDISYQERFCESFVHDINYVKVQKLKC